MALLIHVELFFGIPLFFLGLYDFAPSYTGSPSLSSRMKIRATPAWMGLGDCDHGLEIMVNAWCCFHFVGTCTCLRSTWTYDGRIARGQQALEPFVHLFASVVGSQRILARPQAVSTSRGNGPPSTSIFGPLRRVGWRGVHFPDPWGVEGVRQGRVRRGIHSIGATDTWIHPFHSIGCSSIQHHCRQQGTVGSTYMHCRPSILPHLGIPSHPTRGSG